MLKVETFIRHGLTFVSTMLSSVLLQGNTTDTTGLTHMGIHRDWQHHRFKSNGAPALRGGSGHPLSPLTKELPALETCGKGKAFFSGWESKAPFRTGSTPGVS